jgi:hypothetical protein
VRQRIVPAEEWPEGEWLTVRDAARRRGWHRNTVAMRVRDGRLPSRTIGGVAHVPAEAIDACTDVRPPRGSRIGGAATTTRQVTLRDDQLERLRAYAERKHISVPEALRRLLDTALALEGLGPTRRRL